MMTHHRHRMRFTAGLGIGCMAGLALAGCFDYSPHKIVFAPELLQPRLPSLQDGQSSRTAIEAALGQPTMRLSDGRIVTYDLLLDEPSEETLNQAAKASGMQRSAMKRGDSIAFRQKWTIENAPLTVLPRTLPEKEDPRMQHDLDWSAEYMLVLVFDGRGVLQRHRFWSVTS